MLAKALATTCALALFAGCAAEPAQLRLAADHPANPDAPAAPAPPVSTTLAFEPAASAVNAPEPSHDHSAMQHSHDGQAAEAAAVYVCPHHPEVTSDKPDQRCPKCGMTLVKKEQPPDTGAGGGHEGHHD